MGGGILVELDPWESLGCSKCLRRVFTVKSAISQDLVLNPRPEYVNKTVLAKHSLTHSSKHSFYYWLKFIGTIKLWVSKK